MIKIISIFGTRPEAIKMAPLIKKLKSSDKIESIVCITAQHRELLDSVLDLFEIMPKYDLDIMKKKQTLSEITTLALNQLGEIISNEKPDMILVHGDTTSTFAGGLAAFYQKIKVGHVEAGLRSGNIYSPYPEEMNRSLMGRLANVHFAPTLANKKSLLEENINTEHIFVTGNTVIDAMLSMVKKKYVYKNPVLNNIDFDHNKIIILTTHRRENLGKPMENIFRAVKRLISKHPDLEIVFPMHPNPKVREIVYKFLTNVPRVHLIEPIEYKSFANLLARCYLVMTDSGGIQEEAPALGKPVVVLRAETERPEAVRAGTVKIVGIEEDAIYQQVERLITDEQEYLKMAKSINPYGDGKACDRILDSLLYYFGLNSKRPKDYV